MYHSPVLQRSPDEEEDRSKRDKMSTQHLPPYTTRSPTQAHYKPYSPTDGPRPRLSYSNQYHTQASTPTALPPPQMLNGSPRLRTLSPPTTHHLPPINGSAYNTRDKGASTYYDPTSDQGGRDMNWNRSSQAHHQSPLQTRDLFNYRAKSPEPRSANSAHHSPTVTQFPQHSPIFSTSHAHPPTRYDSIAPSPLHGSTSSPTLHQDANGYPAQPSTISTDRRMSLEVSGEEPHLLAPELMVDLQKPSRAADPMSFSSILSNPNTDTPAPASHSQRVSEPTIKSMKSSSRHRSPATDEAVASHIPRRASNRPATPLTEPISKPSTNGAVDSNRHTVPVGKIRLTMSDKENEKVAKAMAEIDAMDLSDIDAPGFSSEREDIQRRSFKRALEIENVEAGKRKRRRVAYIKKMSDQIGAYAQGGKSRFRQVHQDAAQREVQLKEIQDEKERKKDMQRIRRRQKTVQTETQKRLEALEKAQQAADQAERDKYLRDAQRAEKKAVTTKRILECGDAPEEIREVTPVALNLEGGTMSQFQTGEHISPEPPKKKPLRERSTRPKKTKEKKQAEKDAAEAAYAAMEREELVLIAPKEDTRKPISVPEPKEVKETKQATRASSNSALESKGYHQIYDQIWRDIARKDIPKVYRVKENSLSTKQSNLRKTAQLASKEARRWQLRTNKSMKDVQARAKRTMREMMSFWKRNEREERDLRRVAEKQELEHAKRAEADREANRQKRKLNFLISQTELYSHFIGRKIKTDEVERSTDTDGVAVSAKTVQPGKDGAHTITLPDSVGKPGTKVTNFEDLDFDAEDETVLKQAAMANAQNAVQEAQDRARAFNGEENQLQAQFDEGEMNFQNPTSLGDVDVSQPKMLTAQLKEYQLKGLNWLVNLYEQGINGILADEMGLGKTVQSISVMAYLAEKHNIWGPFLVIAPSSTLHNWQQEISRFVPDLKVLPYWGTAKDRKVLRKFWDRKHITYTKESPFHVLVTSYQLVVQDTQYFQKIRWQYMILDEAQAIKSSQSSRWKSLLGFHCRNRLLLTGTPIQNNMQELWALLHFIMPSLFDSHDEFSDWFSKDIESHAQSNTKLNEDQLKRLHMILKPFMLRRIKKHVQKELGDKIEEDVFCDLTYRQRAYYGNLRNRISIMDLIEKAAVGDDQDTATLMNLVMQFRKVCNHPDLFERAETTSPLSLAYYAETASFLREGQNVNVGYSTRNLIEYDLPRLVCGPEGRLDVPGPENARAGFRSKFLGHLMNIWTPENIYRSSKESSAFSWLRFADTSAGEACATFNRGIFERAVTLKKTPQRLGRLGVIYDEEDDSHSMLAHAMFNIVDRRNRKPMAEVTNEGRLHELFNVSRQTFEDAGLNVIEQCARPAASAPPIEIRCSNQDSRIEKEDTLFNIRMRRSLYGISEREEQFLLDAKVDPAMFPVTQLLPPPVSEKARYTNIRVPSMRRFVTDSGKLAKLDQLLRQLKNDGHRVLLYFQMTRMIDLMEEYLTYRNYKYLRLDGSTKLEDRRDTVHDFQTRPEIFIFLLSTRAGGLGINLTAADTVIFYDSDWNPTIDSQAMDRAHRLGQTKQVTVYRMITRGTIEERIRKRALQKEEVQRVVISGGSGAGVDFNTRSKENRTKDIAMWLADDEQAELIERKEKEVAQKGEGEKGRGKKSAAKKKGKDVSLDDMYHEGEGHFDDGSNKPSGAATPVSAMDLPAKGKKSSTSKAKGTSKKAKTTKERLRIVDGEDDMGMGGM